MPDSHVKISGRSDYNTLQNLSSNNIEKKESEMSRIGNPFEISNVCMIFLTNHLFGNFSEMSKVAKYTAISYLRKVFF
jgi:hypothetical protein